MTSLTCDFCAFECTLRPGRTGVCGVRWNNAGSLETKTWGRIVSAAVDPVEKKPLYHYLPGTGTFSIALAGCNFRCLFCQNATIAQPEFLDQNRGRTLTPQEVVVLWHESGAPSISFTYSEPTVWQDYLIEVARGVKGHGGRTIMVTNGFFSPAARQRLPQCIDAFNIDLKGGAEFYRLLCKARPEPVIETIAAVTGSRHVEVTTMYMESRHTREEMVATGRILADAGVQVWHISRFFPAYRMSDELPTGEAALADLLGDLRQSIDIPFIYGGNSRQLEYQQTHCPDCGTLCIGRGAGKTVADYTRHGQCPSCGKMLYGVFS